MYGKIAAHLRNFLREKEIASKTWFRKPRYHFSQTAKARAWIEDFDHVNEDFLKLRAKYHLSEVWRYFVPSMIELPIFLALHLSCSFERLL
ncbi:MAG: hypothetical protein DRO98_04750 [Archaeoglobales archaeon]|nr:MAG: hypothetical protein DRO98_04750 [Archaeoglobales archaeon]